MNKRLKKKIKKIEYIKKEQILSSKLSKKICPICGNHTLSDEGLYVCYICNRKYSENEVIFEKNQIKSLGHSVHNFQLHKINF